MRIQGEPSVLPSSLPSWSCSAGATAARAFAIETGSRPVARGLALVRTCAGPLVPFQVPSQRRAEGAESAGVTPSSRMTVSGRWCEGAAA